MPYLTIEVDIARPRAEVLAWWTGFPQEYTATDRREQPHRIKVVKREPDRLEVLTWWRGLFGVEVMVPEVFHLKANGDFDVDVTLPLGLAQHDRFTFTAQGNTTHLHVELDLSARNALGTLARPAYALYGRRQYPITFQNAARLCERDAPRVGG